MTETLATSVVLTGFDNLGLDPRLIDSLTTLGYEEPTPIQRAAIPSLLAGRDLIGRAATGTGKTAAFALPLLQLTVGSGAPRGRTTALVLVPTRELAMQVAEAVHRYGRDLGVSVLPIYGGQSMSQQLRVLKRGVDVVVATPGRALDHIRRGTLDLGGVRFVVLDEADEMLDMGFAEDLEAILDATPTERQTALFSATMPARIAAIGERHLSNPVRVEIASEKLAAGAAPRVRQTVYFVPRAHKLAALARVLDMESPGAAIIFCRTRTEVDQLTETLNGRGYRSEALHGGLNQEQRDRVMKRFREGALELLVATDVAARGLDIDHLSHVFNYDVPSAPEAYVHRIGRTGRAGRDGIAITFAEPREHRLLRNIEQHAKAKLQNATVPTVADLRARRMELLRASLRESLLADELERYRVVVESLADEFDLVAIASAAVKLADAAADGATEADAEVEIPLGPALRERGRTPSRGGREEESGTGFPKERQRRGPRTQVDTDGRGGNLVRIFVGAGRDAGIRPGDLVGAIANEARIDSRAIGAIQIADRFSLVELPETMADSVIEALRGTTIKGKTVPVRRDVEAGGARPRAEGVRRFGHPDMAAGRGGKRHPKEKTGYPRSGKSDTRSSGEARGAKRKRF